MHRYGPELADAPEPKIHADALRCLEGMSWPGNVRELENVIERSLVMCSCAELDADDIRLENAPRPRQQSGDPSF